MLRKLGKFKLFCKGKLLSTAQSTKIIVDYKKKNEILKKKVSVLATKNRILSAEIHDCQAIQRNGIPLKYIDAYLSVMKNRRERGVK